MPKTIVVPIDLSQQDAGAKALAQAKQHDPEGKIALVHVVAPVPAYVASNLPARTLESREEDAQNELSAFALRNDVAAAADIVIRTGHASREILRYAEEANADLIVLASHDPGWSDFLLGSVAASVVRHAHCSVFIVRE